ncbi:MAG: phosphoethanolamine transferase [Betaproteobacteria bacterium]|uniref:Phosphoethanolamine transferase n=1 Tax=Candidatus Proximibacter danicus TaxID=2954365 RepID=A0A9D7K1X5_9PROT|nr:phosphoethanolamine transferase [Candidatus Proximibacter danicus]
MRQQPAHPFLTRIAQQISTRPKLGAETLILLICLWFTATSNSLFWQAAMERQTGSWTEIALHGAALALLLTTTHFLLLACITLRRAAKPLLAIIVVLTTFASHYMGKYHVYLDPDMLRNILRTDYREASELFSWGMIPALLAYALPPLLLLARVDIKPRPLLRATGIRLFSLLLAMALAGAAGFAIFKDFSSLMREKKEVRYLITPANYLYSSVRAVASDTATASKEKVPVGSDAVLSAAWAEHKKPVLMVVVIGETARSANWGLSGYARQTTPELAGLNVINFSDVTACGTNTEVSVPCMLSPYGRNNYDEAKIRGSESLLHVLKRAGLRTTWIDNQSGCKGTCDGLENWRPDAKLSPADCNSDGCLDGAMLAGVRQLAENHRESQVIFLHTLGNHGPAYSKRYPKAFQKFLPACESSDLGKCTQQEIVNAYDNALLYTDHVLAQTIAYLKTQQSNYDTALLYVSVSLDTQCLRQRAGTAISHDHLFHTTLALLDVQTSALDTAYDFSTGCTPGNKGKMAAHH